MANYTNDDSAPTCADKQRPAGASAAHTHGITIRAATTADVPHIKSLIDMFSGKIMLEKSYVNLYESIQEFVVAEREDGTIVGCGAVHVFWMDLGEFRSVVVSPTAQGLGIGHKILNELKRRAIALGLQRVFVLTFETHFFQSHGFREIEGTPVSQEVFAEMLLSYDDGVAEFLDLSYVKPNTLGNTRMLLDLYPSQG